MYIFLSTIFPGNYTAAIKAFDTILVEKIHHVWFRKEMAYYYVFREKKSLKTYNYDDDLRMEVKHGMSQHDAFVIPNKKTYKSYKKYGAKKMNVTDIENEKLFDIENSKKIEYLLKATRDTGKLIQLDHPGFLPNQRQHRQFGLAVLQISQSLNEHITLLYENKVREDNDLLMTD